MYNIITVSPHIRGPSIQLRVKSRGTVIGHRFGWVLPAWQKKSVHHAMIEFIPSHPFFCHHRRHRRHQQRRLRNQSVLENARSLHREDQGERDKIRMSRG